LNPVIIKSWICNSCLKLSRKFKNCQISFKKLFNVLTVFYFTINVINCFINTNWEILINATKLYNEKFTNTQFFGAIIRSINVSQERHNSILGALSAIRNLENWSFQLFDTLGKFLPKGIIKGTVTDFGDYDQRLAIEPNEVIGESQYCFIDISLPLPKPMPIHQNFFHKVNVLPQFVNKSENNVLVKLSEDASFFY